MTKILETWNSIGMAVTERYLRLSNGWRITLWLVYVVFAILWLTGMAVIVPISMVTGKIMLGISFTESIEAFKEGIDEGLENLE